ncbi:hypothetical protein AAFF_G00124470 [Aldrovandia affinis]|uniref:Uncharacterized protein n=1 Tax=Aldrovandia affinis TaxID=143900 RepID=A0AAD7RRS2_9TELE|nr:hypothetical protein AAFF_G00124470 [Aldrovandia affinis]
MNNHVQRTRGSQANTVFQDCISIQESLVVQTECPAARDTETAVAKVNTSAVEVTATSAAAEEAVWRSLWETLRLSGARG